ncbi:hypothetical protein QBC43DRAFT_339748 [Cladorrhinum sp. PSN259]|nr:hypothetical protein QBC43DRAFT_339748 [Cladorrhinum sp. PSN259]
MACKWLQADDPVFEFYSSVPLFNMRVLRDSFRVLTATAAVPLRANLVPDTVQDDPNAGWSADQPRTNPSFTSTAFTLCPAEPPVAFSKPDDDLPPPEIIIIASWTGASSRHVEKYTSTYNSIFPGVPILVLTTVVSDLAIHSKDHKIKSLVPAVNYLLTRQIPSKADSIPKAGQPFYSSTAQSTQSTINEEGLFNPYYSEPLLQPPTQTQTQTHHPPRRPFTSILLHAFSEGGSYTSVCLATLYRSLSSSPSSISSSQPTKIPVSALILDSTPGHKPSQSRARSAFAKSLPRPSFFGSVSWVPSFVPFLAVSLSTLTLKVLDRYQEGKNFFDLTFAALNDSTLFPLEGHNVPRLYLFSEQDEIVLWKDIEEHARVAGVKSLCVRFKGTGHCAHICGEQQKKIYWGAVKAVWEMREDGGLGVKLRGLRMDSGRGDSNNGWESGGGRMSGVKRREVSI